MSSSVSYHLNFADMYGISPSKQDGNILRRVVVLLFRDLKPLDTNNRWPDVGPHGGPHHAVSTDRMGV